MGAEAVRVNDGWADVMSDAAKRIARDADIANALTSLRRALLWQAETIREPNGKDMASSIAIQTAIGVLDAAQR